MIELSILSAGEKRIENLRRAEQREKEAQRFRDEKPKRVEELTEKIFNYAKKQIDKSNWDSCEVLITDDELYNKWKAYYEDETLEAIDIVITLLKLAGYRVDDFYQYSKAWNTRSGKFGYFYVRWGGKGLTNIKPCAIIKTQRERETTSDRVGETRARHPRKVGQGCRHCPRYKSRSRHPPEATGRTQKISNKFVTYFSCINCLLTNVCGYGIIAGALAVVARRISLQYIKVKNC